MSTVLRDARRIVVKARKEIEAARLPATLDGLREFRRRVMGGAMRRLVPLTAWEDFWSASLLRDLCFHVQEHRLTLDAIGAFLREHDLALLGFQCGRATLQAYARRFAGERQRRHREGNQDETHGLPRRRGASPG